MYTKLTLVFLFVAAMLLMSYTKSKKRKVIFFGDSITEQGVQANGYITQMKSLIANEGLSEQYELSGSGISGNKVYDLYLRLDEDVINKSPNVVFIFIGTNDVWHKKTSHTGTDIDKFLKFYKAIIKKIEASGSKVIICTPAVIGEQKDGTNDMDDELNGFVYQIIQLSKELNLPLVNLRHAFYTYYIKNNPNNEAKGILTVDGVHLNASGNEIVAHEMWNALRNLK